MPDLLARWSTTQGRSALFAIALVLYLAGNGSHALWDRDEPRYACATRAMVDTGDWLIPHFNGDVRDDKPIGIYWFQAMSVMAFGANESAVRLPSSLAGATTALITHDLALRLGCSTGGAVVAGGLMTFGVMPLLISKAATTDAVLGLLILLSMSMAIGLWRDGFTWPRWLGMWTMLAGSALVKGPVGPAVLGVTALTLWITTPAAERPKLPLVATALRLVVGLAAFFALALPWAWAVWVSTDGAFVRDSFQEHVVERSLEQREGHGGPPILSFLYYVPVLIFGLFPGTPLVWRAAPWAWTQRHQPIERLLLCWIVPNVAVFTLVQTKLPHYIFPVMPAVAILAARCWDRGFEAIRIFPRWDQFGEWMAALIAVVVALGLPSLPLIVGFGQVWPATVAPVVIGVLALIMGAQWAMRLHDEDGSTHPWLIVVGTVWCAVAFTAALVTLPALEAIRPSKVVTRWTRDHAPARVEVMASEYREDSLAFYWTHGYVWFLGKGDNSRRDALQRLNSSKPWALITTESRWAKWHRESIEQNERSAGRTTPGFAENVTVRASWEMYLFQRGRHDTVIVVGNWAAD